MFHNFNILLKEITNYLTASGANCINTNVPRRVQWNERSVINSFSSSEKIFRRCKPELIQDPFGKLSLYDLSHNRSGLSFGVLSKEKDVFLDYSSADSTSFDNENLILLSIDIFLNNQNNLTKTIFSQKDNSKTASLILSHKPVPCNFYHTCIEFKLNQTLVTKVNYKSTLGKRSNKILRDQCRHELADIIFKRKIFHP